MRNTFTRLFAHAVWATWDRLPLITPNLRQALYACLQAECAGMRVDVIEIGGLEDHVHILGQLPATVAVADWIKQIKGSSSHLSTHALEDDGFFKWQGAYSAFSVSEADVPRVAAYIRNQEEHHRHLTTDPRFEID